VSKLYNKSYPDTLSVSAKGKAIRQGKMQLKGKVTKGKPPPKFVDGYENKAGNTLTVHEKGKGYTSTSTYKRPSGEEIKTKKEHKTYSGVERAIKKGGYEKSGPKKEKSLTSPSRKGLGATGIRYKGSRINRVLKRI